MKRFIFNLLYCFAVCVSVSSFAQTSVTVLSPHMANPAQQTLIREYQSAHPATVTCYNSDTTVTFVYSDNTVQVMEKTLKGYWINDMVIVGEELFFCGKDINRKRGIIGGFNINGFFFGSGQISILPNLFVGNDALEVLELTRMTDFAWEYNNVRIACIGICGDKITPYPCLIDFNADFTNPVYTGGYVKYTKESFTDIKVVKGPYMQNYLVTTGFDFTYGRYINVRVYGPNSVFSPSGIQDMCHLYCIDTAEARPWLSDAVRLTKMGSDRFVTVSYRNALKNRDFIEPVFANTNIHLALFSLSDIINNSTQALLSNYEIPLGVIGLRNMSEIIYSSQNKSLVFLHTYITNSLKSEFCEVDYNGLASSGTLPAFCDPDIIQQGLDLYNSMDNYILSGYKHPTPTMLKYEMETFGSYPQCVNGLEYNYEKKPIIKSMNYELKFNTEDFSDVPIHIQPEIIYIGVFLDCER